MENSIRKETVKSPVTVEKVYTAEYQKEGTKTAQLRQRITVKSFYPSKQISSNLSDNPFSAEEFGFAEQEYETAENRVAWINVPATITNPDDVLARLNDNSTLYRMMSNHPILTTGQIYSIDQGLKTMDDFAHSQVVRHGEKFSNGQPNPDAGKLIKDDNGKPQYRAIFFSNTPKEDVDNRTSQADDFYASEQIKSELVGVANVVQGQELV